MPEQIKMPDSLRQYLITDMIGQKIEDFTIMNILGCGNTAVTYEVVDKNDFRHALKLVTRESYMDRAPFREIARFSQTQDERYLVFPKDTGDWSVKVHNKNYEFIWFKARRVVGETLENFLKSSENWCGDLEIKLYLEHMTIALEELARLQFSHGDLHERNIMREVIGRNGKKPEIRYVIIDFSEAHPINYPEEGLLEDIECFGQHLRKFTDAINVKKAISEEEKKVLEALTHIPGLVNGMSSESMRIFKPGDILDRFMYGLQAVEKQPQELQDPFNPLHTENITDERLLTKLFAEVWWKKELEKNKNLLLVGPRGCGKSMIFKRLRLKTKIKGGKEKEVKQDSYVAFYIPCESVFYLRFSRLSKTEVDKYKDALILFFNMAFLDEICSTLGILKETPSTLYPKIIDLLKEEIGPLLSQLNLQTIITNMSEISMYATNIMRNIRRSIAYSEDFQAKGTTEFVTRLVQIIKAEIPNLSGKYFAFFLDDYTDGYVPIALQEILHPIIAQRSPDVCFKISAHMFGSIYNFPRPLSLDEGRIISVINLGSAYLGLNKSRKEGDLLLEILNNRFKNNRAYGGTIEKWLGETSYPGGRTLSQSLHDKTVHTKVYYHGTDCLKRLCTGDYHEMIRIVGEIFREAKIEPGAEVVRIQPSIQDRVIYRASREYLSRVRHIRPDGQKLYDIVDSFGRLSKSLVRTRTVKQGKTSKGKTRREPFDLLTIYVDDITKASTASKSIWQRLQKASIFVNIGLAASQKSFVAERGTLRRIYCPAFRTTLTDSEHLELTKMDFEYFMDKPDEFCKDQLRRRTRSTQIEKLWEEPEGVQLVTEPEIPLAYFPKEEDKVDFDKFASDQWTQSVSYLPPLVELENAIPKETNYDLFIGAMGFEERTSKACESLLRLKTNVNKAVLLEFDRYYDDTEKKREGYENILNNLTRGGSHRILNAPVDSEDHGFPQRLKKRLDTVISTTDPNIVFDCTSCPSLILSQTIAVLLDIGCNLTILYSEAAKYYPTAEEYAAAQPQRYPIGLLGPYEGVGYVAQPTLLQGDDTGEHPVLLVLFPTFNSERTAEVLNNIDPAERIWIFGEPHDLSCNEYRIEMEKSYAATIMSPRDKWSLISTFDYKNTLLALGGVYKKYHSNYRITIMPHGSKMQTIAVNLFAKAHDTSLAFAMPKDYNPKRYSEGCSKVWAIQFGNTKDTMNKLRLARVI
jgi:RIO-like serine/threonine protein kinase/energy-coupling factor transporter ATP-binding protein EcfA2